jgi:Ca-activated chloride channel family protein
VVLVTDGLIGFEQEVVATVLRGLPAGSRLHAVGVGDSVNRSLTAPVARAGRGLEVLVGLGEAAGFAARALVARTTLPLVTGLTVEGPGLAGEPPALLPDLFGGAPVLVPVEIRPSGGEIVLRGSGAAGRFERRVAVPAVEVSSGSPTAAALFAREAVEALEMRGAAGEPRRAIDAEIEKVGLDFQIATRLTAWVAVSEEPTVDPREPIRRERMPQALPHGLSVEGLGLRHRMPSPPACAPAASLDEVAMHVYRPTAPASFAAPAPPAFRRRPAPEASAGLSLQGSYTWRGGYLVVTVEVEDGEVEWQLPAEVEVTDVWDESHACPVDTARTTRSGTVAAGASLRIVLAWPEDDRPELTRLVARVGSREIAIDLTEA